MDAVWEWVVARLKEKSTYAGIATFLVGVIGLGSEYLEPMEALAAAAGGVVLVGVKTKKGDGATLKCPPASLVVALALMLTLTACAGALPWNKQNNAGIVDIHTSYDCSRDESGGVLCMIKEQRIIDGKEQGAIDIKYVLADGTTLNYAADQVAAFKGQELRANVEAAIAEQLGDVAPEVIDTIVDRITGGVD